MKEKIGQFSISPLDDRYKNKAEDLALIFSEFGLMRARFIVEVKYLIALGNTGILPSTFTSKEEKYLINLIKDFDEKDYERIKEIEKVTNHDVKAVEYYLREKLKTPTLKKLVPYVHIGRTSEDINNISYALMLRDGIKIIKDEYEKIIKNLSILARENKKTPMLALTHGQPASPTTFGWEMNVFKARLEKGLKTLVKYEITAKINGATGGDNALYSAYPNVNWRKFADNFIKDLNAKGLNKIKNNPFTTQIEPHDTYRELFDILRSMNLVLIDFSKDMWMYISRNVVVQIPKKGEVGSSAMPQKVNPIDFENAEGNLGLANALCVFFGDKLTNSRLQRDLSDSTVERNFGLVFGHTKIALLSLDKGLGRIKVHKEKMAEELENHWEVVSEAYQVVMRSEGVNDGYELLKDFSRGRILNKESMHDFVDGLLKKGKIDQKTAQKLKKITPTSYIGNREF